MNVLGVIFDTKLQWAPQTITKTKQALHAIKIIRPHFNTSQWRHFLMANFFSILY